MNTKRELSEKAIDLLQELITIPSFSTEEAQTAASIMNWLDNRNIPHRRSGNNIIAQNRYYDTAKPTLLLNSHHDTVQPNAGYTRDPFKAEIIDGRLYGLGSNDAGGPLVSLMAAFAYFYEEANLSHNLILVASGEEENSGPDGLRKVITEIPEIAVAIVGEPTLMQLAIAEKGLVVFDATVNGVSSHAAHNNDDNPIYKSIETLEWFKNFEFDQVSETLGPVKTTVTQIKAGSQHNVVPAQVDLVVDVRVNDKYTNQQVAEILEREAPCKIKARSLRHQSSSIDPDHPLVQAGVKLGRSTYGSPTLSDQAVLSCPSLKLGPGDSTRSHTADEFIYVEEINDGISIYIDMLEEFLTKTSGDQ